MRLRCTCTQQIKMACREDSSVPITKEFSCQEEPKKRIIPRPNIPKREGIQQWFYVSFLFNLHNKYFARALSSIQLQWVKICTYSRYGRCFYLVTVCPPPFASFDWVRIVKYSIRLTHDRIALKGRKDRRKSRLQRDGFRFDLLWQKKRE